jgi:hypothetical protein
MLRFRRLIHSQHSARRWLALHNRYICTYSHLSLERVNFFWRVIRWSDEHGYFTIFPASCRRNMIRQRFFSSFSILPGPQTPQLITALAHIINKMYLNNIRLRWPQFQFDFRHEMPSPARTLGSSILLPFNAVARSVQLARGLWPRSFIYIYIYMS